MLPPTDNIDPRRYLALVQALAAEGNPRAQHNLGAMYLKGLGVKRDPSLAAEWFEKAGEQGDLHAQHNLGVLYLQGIGVTRNPRRAAKWFRLAALQGDHKSAQCLGALYFEGQGIPRDLVRAYIWLSRALPGVPEALQTQIREALTLVSGQLDEQSLSDAMERIPLPDDDDDDDG